MGKGKKALVVTASVIGGFILLSMLAALLPDDGDSEETANAGTDSDTSAQLGENAEESTTDDGSSMPDNVKPTARFTFDCTHLSCDFDGTASSDPDGNVASWSWDLGDGSIASGPKVNHTYADDSTNWIVTLTVTDDSGATHSTSELPDVAAPPPDPITFSDSGDKVTASFVTEQKLLRVIMDHRGSSNFAIWLLDDQGNNEELLVNEIGTYDGSRYFSAPAGEYRLEVTADGSWSVMIEQPRDAGTQPEPKHGTGDTAIAGVQLEQGLVVLEMSYQGDSNFAVFVYDADGDIVELAANEIGDYDGQEAIQIPRDGVYYIDVTAHGGTWTMKFS